MTFTEIDVQLKHPFSMMVSGGRGVGKTTFTTSLLKDRNSLIDTPLSRIVWCYTKHQPELLKELLDIEPNIEYVQGIPSNIEEMFDRKVNNLIVLDDMMSEASNDNRVSNLFTRGRHDNLSVIFLTQNLFHKNQREISLNSDYITIFKNPRDKTQFLNLAKQIMPRNLKFLIWAYDDATKELRSYIFLDLKAETEDAFRVRANILPSDGTQILYQPN